MIAATNADAVETVALWHACGLTRPWNDPHADFALALATSTSTILLARDGDTLIGSVMVGFNGHRGWIYYLAVAPNRRRGGIGRALMAAAEAWLAEHDAPKVQLMVRDTNDAALGFYARLGYAPQAVVTLGRFLNGMVKP
ncbi:GNAT family acetyltransferase [Sphingomonas sp. GC_Shp_3]|uniref:GNAT family acetyltransferase n=1 Tax=Sphingomonas sp. GC_Shp_3 TaxID=2937383 RepID=UPI002269DDAD|nr:GNAT family acetyltransferase [Sphingomonas sp. GC_Shp_3]